MRNADAVLPAIAAIAVLLAVSALLIALDVATWVWIPAGIGGVSEAIVAFVWVFEKTR